LNLSKGNFNEFQTALADMNMQNQFNKMSVLNVKQFQKISKYPLPRSQSVRLREAFTPPPPPPQKSFKMVEVQGGE
jgi:hypothetical protein